MVNDANVADGLSKVNGILSFAIKTTSISKSSREKREDVGISKAKEKRERERRYLVV